MDEAMESDKSLPKRYFSIGPMLLVTLSFLIVITAGVIGYYSFNSGQKAAIKMFSNIQNNIQINIKRDLNNFLNLSHDINKMNAEFIISDMVIHHDLKNIKTHFFRIIKSFERIKSVGFGSKQKNFIGAGRRSETVFASSIADKTQDNHYYVHLADEKGNYTKLEKVVKNYNPCERGWYKSAIKTKGPTWSPVYVWVAQSNIGVSAVLPVYDSIGNELGVVLSAIPLGFISDYLNNLERIYSEQVFIIDRSGMLIATSSSEPLIQPGKSESGAGLDRVQAKESENYLIQASAHHLITQFSKFDKISDNYQTDIIIEKQQYFLKVTPFSDGKGLDWLVVIVTPKENIIGPIKSSVQTTIMLSALILLCALFIGFGITHFILRPIIQLNNDIKKVIPGEWIILENNSRFKEIYQLTSSYNFMIQQLQVSFKTLEQQVEARTNELYKANENLKKNKKLLDATGSMARIGGWELETDTLQVSWTDETYFIHEVPLGQIPSLEEAINFFHPDDREVVSKAIQRALEFGEAYDIETRFITAKGKHRWTRTICNPELKNGKTVKLIGIFHDITEIKDIETQLRQSHKMESIGTITGGIAHDFNNILGIILGNTELALDDVPEWNPAHSNLEEIKTAGLRATNIVRQLLSFSRKTDQKLEPIEIALVIKDALNFLRSTIPTTIDIEQDIQITNETILADPTQINQIIMNLCINASHAMEETGGAIKVIEKKVSLDNTSAKAYPELSPGEHIMIQVSDTGKGVDPDIIDRIFDPYFTTKKVGKGSGMGLSVVHGIVKNHSGTITVDSNPGIGTRFSILFPLATEKPMAETKTSEELSKGNETILFVDDEISIIKMVQRMIERLGYKVETATTPQDALDRFLLNPDYFDMVITDMTMPQMTGVKLSEKLMEIRPGIPIIICTGHSALVDEEKAKELGLAEYVMKPINMQEISQSIRKVLDRK